jgi:hypothetical protein
MVERLAWILERDGRGEDARALRAAQGTAGLVPDILIAIGEELDRLARLPELSHEARRLIPDTAAVLRRVHGND